LAELSGGLDSSSIVCTADRILADDAGLTSRLDTLSYFDTTEPNGDDNLYFPKVEQLRGRAGWHIDASKLASSPAELEAQQFSALPGLLGHARQLETERAAILESGGYRVVLSGIGGDEFLGGIPNPAPLLADLLVQFRLMTLGKELVAWGLAKRRPAIQLLRHAIVELLPLSLVKRLSSQATVEKWIDHTFAKRMDLSSRLVGVPDYFGFLLPTRRACIGGVVVMQNKMAKQRASRTGLQELRYPFLDQQLLQFILAIPASQILRASERRSLMRRALKNIVPAEILSRRTKQFGARTPVLALEANWQRIVQAFSNSQCSDRGYITDETFREALQSLKMGRGVHLQHVLRTISLELWLTELTSRGLIADRYRVSSMSTRSAYPAAPTASSNNSKDFHYSC
jgi:asparagine synthase (glutamine-hydrolysing)